KQWADHFNEAGRVARSGGIWLGFHNEPDHMKPIDGEVPYDVFVKLLDPASVRLQLDVGNMLVGGGDPVKYYAQDNDRYWSFHVKDVTADHSKDTELGTGVFDFSKFLKSIPDLSKKPCYVEQEFPKDEMDSARKNFAFLHALVF